MEPIATPNGIHCGTDSYLEHEESQGTSGILLTKTGATSGFPTNKKKKIFCTGKPPCQRYLWLWLPLLSLQAAESVKRKRKITINLKVSCFSPYGLKYPTKDLPNPSQNPHRLPIYDKLGPHSVSMGEQRTMFGHMKRLKVQKKGIKKTQWYRSNTRRKVGNFLD